MIEAQIQREQKIIDILADELFVDAKTIKPEMNLQNDLGADSLDAIELVMRFEAEFEVDIFDEEAEKVVTVQDMFDVIAGKVG